MAVKEEIIYLVEDKYGNISPLREILEFKFGEAFDLGNRIELLAHSPYYKSANLSSKIEINHENVEVPVTILKEVVLGSTDMKSLSLKASNELFLENVLVSIHFSSEYSTGKEKKSVVLSGATEFFHENVFVPIHTKLEKTVKEKEKSVVLTSSLELFFEDWFNVQ